MGGVLSVFVSRRTTRKIFVKPVRVSSHSYADQVDVDVLFSALLKLACVFEVKETLATSLKYLTLLITISMISLLLLSDGS